MNNSYVYGLILWLSDCADSIDSARVSPLLLLLVSRAKRLSALNVGVVATLWQWWAMTIEAVEMHSAHDYATAV